MAAAAAVVLPRCRWCGARELEIAAGWIGWWVGVSLWTPASTYHAQVNDSVWSMLTGWTPRTGIAIEEWIGGGPLPFYIDKKMK